MRDSRGIPEGEDEVFNVHKNSILVVDLTGVESDLGTAMNHWGDGEGGYGLVSALGAVDAVCVAKQEAMIAGNKS